jgi:hypothetical protein
LGKRSDFPRIPADFYPTPSSAVLPLLPHLEGVRVFAEPCAGDGDLVRHLEGAGLQCGYAGDINRGGRDALAVNTYGEGIDAIITNPPHTRELMHELITHFVKIAPTWLLIDLDWAATVMATPYIGFCTDIVVIGRVKWIKGSRYTGKDNYCWYRFTRKQRIPTTVFHCKRTIP